MWIKVYRTGAIVRPLKVKNDILLESLFQGLETTDMCLSTIPAPLWRYYCIPQNLSFYFKNKTVSSCGSEENRKNVNWVAEMSRESGTLAVRGVNCLINLGEAWTQMPTEDNSNVTIVNYFIPHVKKERRNHRPRHFNVSDVSIWCHKWVMFDGYKDNCFFPNRGTSESLLAYTSSATEWERSSKSCTVIF